MYKISKIVPLLCAALLLTAAGVQAQNAPAPTTAAPSSTPTPDATHKPPAATSPDATHKVPASQTSPTPAPSASTGNGSGG